MTEIKITKLPRHLNENELVYDEVFKESCICPYCNKSVPVISHKKEWYGTEDSKLNIFNLFKEKHNWAKFEFLCRDCGAKWESRPFRTDYPDDTVMREIKEE